MFTKDDFKRIADRGIAIDDVYRQIDNFKNGFPAPNVISPATPDNGIVILDDNQQSSAISRFDSYDGSLSKFVPASGAASRMFKDLYQALDLIEKGETLKGEASAQQFFDNIGKFPFLNGSSVLNLVLGEKGLGYGTKPKGMILFHKYENETRTAFEEHLVEGASYCLDKNGVSTLYFTVSPEHIEGFEELFDSVRERYEKRFGCRFQISFTTQSPSTDTVAVEEDNTPFRDEHGEILFRPGGHGALLKNLNETESALVIIKNIDNVAKEHLLDQTIMWKKIICGVLIEIKEKIFGYLNRLDSVERNSDESAKLYGEIIDFLRTELFTEIPDINSAILHDYLYAKLNRPIRVCGMVKNEGEPGGGPYIVRDNDGSSSLQILESAQLDMKDPEVKKMVSGATHFNPVDLVVWIKDYKGNRFDLNRYTDPMTGFISTKSYEGRVLKAQELPGLWNGAMSNWNTLFVETPLITFNPVKTVMDLLRPEHQG